MKLAEAFKKMRPGFALDLFNRAGAIDTITFEEWIDATAEVGFVNAGKCSLGLVNEVLLRKVCSLAKSFEDHLLVLKVMSKWPWLALEDQNGICKASQTAFEQFVEKADTFSRCKTAHEFTKSNGYYGLGPEQDRRTALLAQLEERAFHLAQTFEEWHWVYEQLWWKSERLGLCVEKMKSLAASLEHWVILASLTRGDDVVLDTLVELVVDK